MNFHHYDTSLIIKIIWTDTIDLVNIFDITNFSKQNLKFYLQLTDGYNKFYHYQNVIDLCQNLKISIEDFFDGVNLSVELLQSLKEHSLWIGDPLPVTKEQLQKHESLIIDVTTSVSRALSRKYYKLQIDDIRGIALDFLLTRCGGIIHNFEDQLNTLKKILISYIYKSLLFSLLKSLDPLYSFTEHQERTLTNDGIYKSENDSNPILDLIDQNEMEKKLIQLMRKYIENDQEIDYIKIATELNISQEEIESIKKDLQKKILQLK